MKTGTKVQIRDGNGTKFATTYVIDPEPEPPEFIPGSKKHKWPGKQGDYALVMGDVKMADNEHLSCMKLKQGWGNEELFKKCKPTTPYLQWPGMLKADFSQFKTNVGTKEMMSMEEFLIDLQYVSIFGGNRNARLAAEQTRANKNKKKARKAKDGV